MRDAEIKFRNRFLQRTLGRLLSIFSPSKTHNVEGKLADVSILFADIRNFTFISDSLPPQEVSALLNEFFKEMIPIINRHNGVVNKFVGMRLLVIFGDPRQNPEHPKAAVQCAFEMFNKTLKIHQRWQKEGKPDIDIGIGISSGIAFLETLALPKDTNTAL